MQCKQTRRKGWQFWCGLPERSVWEWILCIPQEYQRIWKDRFTSISVLYLANRYFGFIHLSAALSLMVNDWSPGACKHMFYWAPVGFLVSTLLSQMILGVRVYAVYAQSRAVLILLCSIFLVEACIGGVTISLTSQLVTGPPGTNAPCTTIPAPFGWMIASFLTLLFFDATTFVLTAWKIYDIWRMEVSTPLVSVIWRDGIFYFFAIFTMNFVNVLVFSIAPYSITWTVNLTPTAIFTIVLSCRLVLNLRNTLPNTIPLAAPSGLTSINNPEVQTNLRHNGGIHPSKTYDPKANWINLPSMSTPVGLDSGSGHDGIKEYPDGIV